MRCLYCGKELALLKRWTSGGEFCSDGHRQQYQEEYNQLALNRLLQAKPSADTKDNKPSGSPAQVEAKQQPEEARKADRTQRPKFDTTPSPKPLPSTVGTPKAAPPSKPVEEHRPATLYVEPEPVRVTAPVMVADEESAPADPAGFLVETPIAAIPDVTTMAPSETDLDRNVKPALPRRNGDACGTRLIGAGRVALELSDRVLDSAGQKVERRLEARELGHTAPRIEFNLLVAGETGLVETCEEPMDILILPHPPPGSPLVWQEAERDFRFETELGILARTAFGTTGLQDNEEVKSALPVAVETSELTVDQVPLIGTPIEISIVENGETVQSAPPIDEVTPARPKENPGPASISAAGRNAKPLFDDPPQVSTKPAEVESVEQASSPKELEPAKRSDPLPDLFTKPLPVTLHGLAAGRGKPVQVFPVAVSTGVELQVPRSSALPLRPVMILGPTPVESAKPEEKKVPERTVVIKPDLRRSQPARPDSRFGNNKGRKLEARAPGSEEKESDKKEPERKEPEKVFASAGAAIKEGARPLEPKKPVESKPTIETSRPPTTYAPDLGLPSLSLQQSGGFWSKLPIAGKIGLAAAVLLAVTGLVILMRSGNNQVVSHGPSVVAGQPLTALDSGWITDWGAETGVRRQHEISVLRPSVSITDYRMEFEAQIESKALGWVYRAQDGKNYYVSKLEIVKPGLEPTVALVRFAVINGEEQPRSQFPLKIPVRIDTIYKIRFDAVGDHFTTWVQDQQVDDWTDDHIKRGGVGLYNERGERMSLRGSVNVVPLVIKK